MIKYGKYAFLFVRLLMFRSVKKMLKRNFILKTLVNVIIKKIVSFYQRIYFRNLRNVDFFRRLNEIIQSNLLENFQTKFQWDIKKVLFNLRDEEFFMGSVSDIKIIKFVSLPQKKLLNHGKCFKESHLWRRCLPFFFFMRFNLKNFHNH